MPLDGEVVLSLRRMRSVRLVDAAGGRLVAEAGTTVGEVQRAAAGVGMSYGVDLASRDAATIGGTVATDAGGVRTVRYGRTRAQLLGCEVVLADGSVIDLTDRPERDEVGYDLSNLVCGSEGTLAVVTKVAVRLRRTFPYRVTVMVGLQELGDLAGFVATVRENVPPVEVVEVMSRQSVELVLRECDLASPFADLPRCLVLLEAADWSDPVDVLRALSSCPGVSEMAVATDGPRRRLLWQIRELHTEAIARVGVAHKWDVAVPLDHLADLLDEAEHLVAAHGAGARLWWFGHLAEGAVHLNVTGLPPEATELDERLADAVLRRGGTLCAEHGVGRAKVRWLRQARTVEEIRAWSLVKRALDPVRVLNPGVLIPAGGTEASA